jgi:hypothetical protein
VQPALLDRVVGVAQRAEHPVRHRPQPRAARLEPPGQPVFYVHWSHCPLSCSVTEMTDPAPANVTG